MWWIIISAVVTFIGILMVASLEKGDGKTEGFVISIIGLLVLSLVGFLLAYNRGKPVILSNMPYSLHQGTVYTVVGIDVGHAIITDETQSNWNLSEHRNGEDRTMWLVELAQTNVVVSKKYMIADVPKSKTEDRRPYTFVEVLPDQ